MTQQQTVSFLHDSGGRLAVQHGTFALMRLEFVVGQFLFPALVVPHDQVFRRMLPFVEQRRQEAMRLARSRSSRIVKGVFDDPHHQAAFVALSMTR